MDGSSSPGNSNTVLWSEFGKGLWCEEQMETSIPCFLSVACHTARSYCCHSANKDKPECCCLLLKIFDIWYEKNGRLKRVKWTFSSWFGLINLWFTRRLCCCACSVWIIPIYQALRNDFLVVRAICHSYPPISRAEGSESHLAVNISLRGFGCILRPVWHVQVKPLCWWGW